MQFHFNEFNTRIVESTLLVMNSKVMNTTLVGVKVGLGKFKPGRDLIPDPCDHIGVFPPKWERAILLETLSSFQSSAHYWATPTGEAQFKIRVFIGVRNGIPMGRLLCCTISLASS